MCMIYLPLDVTQHLLMHTQNLMVTFCRCRIPNEVDSYERNVTYHPVYNVSSCDIRYNGTTQGCTEWVYDQSVFTESVISSVSWPPFNTQGRGY